MKSVKRSFNKRDFTQIFLEGKMSLKSTRFSSFRVRSPMRLGAGMGAGGAATDEPGADGAADSVDFPPRLRRVFTTHACRRQRQNDTKNSQFRMASLIKKPLGIAHSVPLGQSVNFRYSSLKFHFYFSKKGKMKTFFFSILKLLCQKSK